MNYVSCLTLFCKSNITAALHYFEHCLHQFAVLYVRSVYWHVAVNLLPLSHLGFLFLCHLTPSYSLWSHLPNKDQLYMAGLLFLISGEFQGWYIVTWWLTYLNLVSGLHSNPHQPVHLNLAKWLRKIQQIRKKMVQKSKTWPFISKKRSDISRRQFI